MDAGGGAVSGIVLMVLIGLGVAWLWSRVGKRLKMPVNGKQWIWITIIVVVVLAILYGANNSSH
jgi:sterol desaturase/sphingolipid hydroxylase (fatty acid hydroxylase superfamily)